MALTADRVKETSTTTGTGNVTLAGASAGFRTFNDAFGTLVFFYYVIQDANGTGWETGRGYLSSSTVLVRHVVHKSSNANALITLSAGTHTVFSTVTEDAWEDLQGKLYATSRGYNMP